MDDAIALLNAAVELRIFGEFLSGRKWRDWELQAEAYLRGRMEALSEDAA